MRAIVLSLSVAAAIAASALSAPAHAVTAGTASAIEAALAQEAVVQNAAYVCRHRFYTSRRICWWRPSFRYWRR